MNSGDLFQEVQQVGFARRLNCLDRLGLFADGFVQPDARRVECVVEDLTEPIAGCWSLASQKSGQFGAEGSQSFLFLLLGGRGKVPLIEPCTKSFIEAFGCLQQATSTGGVLLFCVSGQQ